MIKHNRLRIAMTQRETVLGWLYLTVQLFVLPGVLARLNGLLPCPLSGTWLNIIFFCVNFCAAIAIFHRFLKQSLALAGKQFGRFLRAAVLGFAAYWVANLALGYALQLLAPGFANVNDSAIIAMTKHSFIPTVIATVVLVPVTEELLYRGLLFQGLYNRNRKAAYAVSVLVFCSIHVMGYVGTYPWHTLALCFLQYVPAGLCLAWAYAEADCIFAPILIHTVINALGIYAAR